MRVWCIFWHSRDPRAKHVTLLWLIKERRGGRHCCIKCVGCLSLSEFGILAEKSKILKRVCCPPHLRLALLAFIVQPLKDGVKIFRRSMEKWYLYLSKLGYRLKSSYLRCFCWWKSLQNHSLYSWIQTILIRGSMQLCYLQSIRCDSIFESQAQNCHLCASKSHIYSSWPHLKEMWFCFVVKIGNFVSSCTDYSLFMLEFVRVKGKLSRCTRSLAIPSENDIATQDHFKQWFPLENDAQGTNVSMYLFKAVQAEHNRVWRAISGIWRVSNKPHQELATLTSEENNKLDETNR